MEIDEAKLFYNQQFQMFKNVIDLTQPVTEQVEEIIERVGKPFTRVLELGAGNGLFARTLADFDKKITTIELVPEIVEFARQLNPPNITSFCGDFYEISLEEKFDLILYLDGFGIGTDEDQLLLLKRIYNWLEDDGVALIDIYQPEYWKNVPTIEMSPLPNVTIRRKYDYDEKKQRMTDTWWEQDTPQEKFTQSLACYSPDEIYALCKKANLEIIGYYPGGKMDYETWQFHEVASLSDCLSYQIKIQKTKE